MKKYSLYLVDFDGTLFDTINAVKDIYRLTFQKYGITPLNKDYPLFITMSLPKTMEYKGLDLKYQKEFCNFFNKKVLSKSAILKTKAYLDTIKFLNYVFTNNIKLGIVTGSSTSRVKDVFNHFKLDYSRLVVCIGNDCYHIPKPDPDPILEALKRTKYMNKKNQVLFIGDAKQDEECAKAAGVDYIQIKRSHNKHGDIHSLLDLFKS